MVDGPHPPDTGDIVWLAFTPQVGHEQAGRRPALVLSPRDYNGRSGLALFCPITSSRKGYPFEVVLPATGKVTGVVLADQIKSLDWRARRARFACRASSTALSEVLAKLSVLLSPP
ncbi:MAG: endoribonuclease MazF [Gammaproteobacteria bacterium]|nr:endoribonuclease MazF [Gammaproteobacteria bacterium]MDE0259816.1 endoribonuclease MazF [Gammaproteobacteria bacterium]